MNELIKENFNVKETYDKKHGNTNRKRVFDIDTASSSVHFQMNVELRSTRVNIEKRI